MFMVMSYKNYTILSKRDEGLLKSFKKTKSLYFRL